jgi:hypothetical protein
MKKIILVLAFIFIASPGFVYAAGQVSVDYYSVESPDYFYPSTFDNLVVDFSVTPDEADRLQALVVKNDGSARYIYEISAVSLWADAGLAGFQGFAVDKLLGAGEYSNGTWIFNNINEVIPTTGKRFFVSLETRKSGTANKTFQFSIPAYLDSNQNNRYDAGDFGIFLESGTSFPMTNIVNDKITAYSTLTVDIHKPVAVITNLTQGKVITENNFLITGAAKDQGLTGITTEICIDDSCFAVTPKEPNFLSWEYNWTGIMAGHYVVYAKATDTNQNVGETERYTVSVETTPAIIVPPVTPPTENPPATNIDYTVGRWVKLADQKAVYFLDSNNTRHAYPTEKVWKSYWGNDFSKVTTISATEMSSFELGRNVPFKVGTLMKIPSVPKVYYVDSNAVIRWVISENAAILRFGTNWAKTVVDLPESFFTDYTSGKNIGETIVLDAN